ncbi:MAG TPA: hypothetical protein VJT72_04760 [Pseudonocardiaceae bacterium]|nr:hypothetical protein [Pseudonocardiaceae bacterium]
MKEVAGENPVRVAAQELRPGGTRASWGRIETGAFEDCPDRGGAGLAAYAGEFSGDAPGIPSPDSRLRGAESACAAVVTWVAVRVVGA